MKTTDDAVGIPKKVKRRKAPSACLERRVGVAYLGPSDYPQGVGPHHDRAFGTAICFHKH